MRFLGTCGGAVECRSTWRAGCLPVEGPASRMGGNCWSRGPESQEASAIWLGGVSAVISASDLDANSFGLCDCKRNEHEGALPQPGLRTRVRTACEPHSSQGSDAMGLQLQSADFEHEDGFTYRIRREALDQDFTIYVKHDGDWVDCGLDQAVKDLDFAEFKRLGLLIKTIMDADRWVA